MRLKVAVKSNVRVGPVVKCMGFANLPRSLVIILVKTAVSHERRSVRRLCKMPAYRPGCFLCRSDKQRHDRFAVHCRRRWNACKAQDGRRNIDVGPVEVNVAAGGDT